MKIEKLMRRILCVALLCGVEPAWGVGLEMKAGMDIGFASHTSSAFANAIYTGYARLSFAGGAEVDVPIGEGFYFHPGLMYAQKGASLEFLGSLPGALVLNNLEFPLLVKKRWVGTPTFSFLLGPTLGFLTTRSIDVASVVPINVSSNYSSVDLGVTAGMQVEVAIVPRFAVIADLRFTLGMLDLNNGQELYQNRDIQILVGTRMEI